MVANMFLKLFTYALDFTYCDDRRYSYFTRNICNQCVDSLKIIFGVSLEACSAIVDVECTTFHLFVTQISRNLFVIS